MCSFEKKGGKHCRAGKQYGGQRRRKSWFDKIKVTQRDSGGVFEKTNDSEKSFGEFLKNEGG